MTVLHQSLFIVPEIVEIARSRGFFDDEELDVRDVMTPSSTAQHRDLDTGRVDLAITSIDNLLVWNAQNTVSTNAGIVQVAQIETTTDLALIARSGLPPLSTVEELRLAVDATSNGFAVVAYAMLARLGVTPNHYAALPVGGVRDRYDALRAGTADITLVAPPLDALGVEQGMTVLSRIADLEPAYPGLGVVTRRDRFTNDDTIGRYLRALDRARPFMSSPPPSLRPPANAFDVLTTLRASVGMTLPQQPNPDDLVAALNDQE